MRTTENTEKTLPQVSRLLGFEKEPRWLTIRFAISVSLALKEKLNMAEKINFSSGNIYNMEVVTGKGKIESSGVQGDYTDLFAVYIANKEDATIPSEKELERYLEFHCERGFNVLSSSLRENSDVFEWLSQEFSQ